jgi:general stress protein 26
MQHAPSLREFLDGAHFAVVATIAPDGLPLQAVMEYELDGDELLLSTPFGSLKHRHLKRDPRLPVGVEQTCAYVTLFGTMTLDEDPARARADYQLSSSRAAVRRNLLDAHAATTGQ